MERFTLSELAEVLGVSRGYLRKRLDEDQIPYVMEGRRIFISFDQVHHWIADVRVFAHSGTKLYQDRQNLEDIFEVINQAA